MELDEMQKKAIETALENDITVINGKAGCVDEETEYFNGNRWVKISEYKKGDKVLVFDNNRNGFLEEPHKYIKLKADKWYHFKNRNLDMKLSPEHRVIYETSKGNINEKYMHDIFELQKRNIGFNAKILTSFNLVNDNKNDLTDNEIKIWIMAAADGNHVKNDSYVFNFKKINKVKRFEKLTGIKMNYSETTGYYNKTIRIKKASKFISDFIYKLNTRQLKIAAKEIVKWDGAMSGRNKTTPSYFTTYKKEADAAQYIFNSLGNSSKIFIDKRKYIISGENRYMVTSLKHSGSSIKKDIRKKYLNRDFVETTAKENEYKYCFVVSTGMLILRRNNNVFITGNCGKSVTAMELKKKLNKLGWDVYNLAPTGRAAKRIKGITIHKWLLPEVEEDNFGNTKIIGFKRFEFDDKDCLLIDESSMIDQEIWDRIMSAWHNTDSWKKKKIVFIGDSGQLEPVGDGTPFIDLIVSGNVPVTTLNVIHRTKDGNDIVEFANTIRDNGMHKKEDYKNVFHKSIQYALDKVIEDKNKNQIISPMKKRQFGTTNINKYVQMTLLEKGELGNELFKTIRWDNTAKRFVDDKEIYINDKILVTKNIDDKITNGTVGIVIGEGERIKFNHKYKINETVKGVEFKDDTDGEILFMSYKDAAKNVDLAYSITVFKAQGSEYDNVYFIVTPDQQYFLDDKMLYTGITRAKEKCYLIVGE